LADANREGWDFTIKPVLLVRQCRPGIRHARIAIVGGLPLRTLGKLQAVVGVVPEDVRLSHEENVGMEPPRRNGTLPDRNVQGTSHPINHCISMRVLVAIVLAFISTAALADSTGEPTTGNRVPTATDVISGLYMFSRFQQNLLESTDLKGNAEVKNLATLRAEEAAKRDKELKRIQEMIGAEPRVTKTTSAGASLAEPENSDGPTYVKSFYAAQIPEYESAINLLERYLKAPDNAALAAFAREQLPILRSQVRDAARTMADK
jgi:hypothetical protein